MKRLAAESTLGGGQPQDAEDTDCGSRSTGGQDAKIERHTSQLQYNVEHHGEEQSAYDFHKWECKRLLGLLRRLGSGAA